MSFVIAQRAIEKQIEKMNNLLMFRVDLDTEEFYQHYLIIFPTRH